MTRDECNPGDLVEDKKGCRWVVGDMVDWCDYDASIVYAHQATKTGKKDKRRGGYGRHIRIADLTVIRSKLAK